MKQLLALLLFLPYALMAQVPTYVPAEGLVAWYPMNNSGSDTSGNGFDGEVIGSTFTTDRFGAEASSAYFDWAEVSGYGNPWHRIEINPGFDGYLEGTFSVAAWINPEHYYWPQNSAHSAMIFGYASRCPNTAGLRFSIEGEGALRLRWGNNAISDDGAIVLNEWQHVVGTIAADSMRVYINGIQVGSAPGVVGPTSGCFNIGELHQANGHWYYFDGAIDDLGVWNAALTEEEIAALYNASSPLSGCSDPEACNYDVEASVDDGSCIPSGCLDETACNFNAEAGCSGGECEYDTDLLDCSIFGFDADSLLACMGEEIEVDAPEVPDAPPGSGSAEFIASFYLDFGGPSEYSLGPQAAGQYEFTVSGTWCGGSCWNGHTSDAAYVFNSPWHNDIVPSGGNSFTINEYCPQDDNSCALIRPEPDEYNPDHVYTYFYDHSGGELVVYGLADECCWGDNQAGLDFSVSRLPASPCALDYAWSTGATSASIITQPVASSYVTVTVSSSVETCTDSLWIEVIDFGCSDPDACNYDASDLCSADCIYPLLGASDCEEGALACGAGTIWDHALQQCVAIELVPDTIVIEPEACAPSCGEGTVWDPVNEECIVAIPADLNYDGCVTVNDLLDLLVVHGTCPPYPEWPDGPADTTWACGDPLTYWDYDYATVLIGDQCWFAENLRTEFYANGDLIQTNLSDSEWSLTTSGAAAVYGEGSRDCNDYSPYGYACDEVWSLNEYAWLYNWYAVSDVRGLCPSGWHVPSDGDWIQMEMALGMSEAVANNTSWRGTNEGHQMKADYGWNNNGNGTNSSGFSCLPGGYCYAHGGFDGAGVSNILWSSSPNGSGAWSRNLVDDRLDIARSVNAKNLGGSIRCLRDYE